MLSLAFCNLLLQRLRLTACSLVQQVQAIRVGDLDRTEVQLQVQMRYSVAGKESSFSQRRLSMSVALDEDIFISQLCLRASLLNQSFQKKVRAVIESHADIKRTRKLLDQSTEHVGGNNSVVCIFPGGVERLVEVHDAPPKTMSRMKEKICEYVYPHPKAIWPLSGNILDPVRLSIVCSGAECILQVKDLSIHSKFDFKFASQLQTQGLDFAKKLYILLS